ncbi:MAG: DUF1080 domain-containing protein, partial [Planctomycetes bacterium]|nr:DUF1080 domain-containing protein [Planctomycetota bacterium]
PTPLPKAKETPEPKVGPVPEPKDAAAAAKWDAIKAEAKKLAEAGKFDEALKALDAAKALPLDGIADLVLDSLDSIESIRSTRLKAALAAYQAESDKLWALLKRRDYPAADKLLAALVGGASVPRVPPRAGDGPPTVEDMLASDVEAAKLLKEFWAAVEKGVAARKGTISIGGALGNVTGVENGVITLQTPKEAVTRRVLDLTAKQALAYAAVVSKDDERSRLAEAIFRIAEGEDPALAEKALAAAGNPPGLAYYRERLAPLLGAKTAKPVEPTPEVKPAPAQKWVVYKEWPFNAAEAVRRQRATAEALGVKSEQDVDLGKGVKMTFVLVPAGEFLMGSPPSTSPERLLAAYGGTVRSSYQSEFPQHRVTLSRPFWMSKHLVTQEQWVAIFDTNPSRFNDDPKKPVEQVDWSQAQEFAKLLGEKLGRAIRLPTEAEWEYACRAGTATEFYFGNDAARVLDFSWPGVKTTAPVGMKKPNAWGLHDMIGTVWQWCGDWFGDYGGADLVDPMGPADGRDRIIRGGHYADPPGARRSAHRVGIKPGTRLGHVGFRVALCRDPRQAAEGPKAGEWQSLFEGKTLAGWKAVEGGAFAGRGRVAVEQGTAVLEAGRDYTGIAFEGQTPKTNYEVALEAMRVEGGRDFCDVTFPVGDSMCALVVGGLRGDLVALSVFEEQATAPTDLKGKRMAFQAGRWYAARVRVSDDRVQAWLDEEKVIDVPRAGNKFTPHPHLAPVGGLGVSAFKTKAVLRNIRLRRIEPGAAEAPKAGEWQGLFDGKTLDGWKVVAEGMYADHGRAAVQGGQIILGPGKPLTGVKWSGNFPSLDYEVALEAMCTGGGGNWCNVTFPVGTSGCSLAMLGIGESKIGLDQVDGVPATGNVTTKKMSFVRDRWYHLKVRVTKAAINVFLDDAEVIALELERHGVRIVDRIWGPLTPFGVASWESATALRNIRLRRIAPEADRGR